MVLKSNNHEISFSKGLNWC